MRDVLAPGALDALAKPLAEWLPERRWFQGKARTVRDVRVADAAIIDEAVLDLFVDIRYADGGSERYQVPLTDAASDASGPALEVDDAVLVDALTDAVSCRALAGLVTGHGDVRTRDGSTIASRPVTGRVPAPADAPRLLRAEQSNSSVVFGDRFILKVLRRIEEGVHPDVELTRQLTEAGFGHIPAQHGSCELEAAGRPPTALAVLADFVAGGREGWDLATAEATRVGAEGSSADATLLPQLEELGAAVAAMHATLADVCGTADPTAETIAGWSAQMHNQIDRVLDVAARRAADASLPVLARRDDLHRAVDALGRLSPAEAGRLVRLHGDLHLGQVLLDPDGRWQLLDFEGEPAKSLAERRLPGPPLRDVAGMLRSFDYAAAAGSSSSHDLPPALVDWRDTARRLFLAGYLREAGGLIPEPAAAEVLLAAFEMDKAVYELGYELANRPPWVPIPVGGILRVVGDQESGRPFSD